MSDKFVDLHIHSFYSDGTMSPEDILATALKKNISLLAITDHNKFDGSLELQKLCSKNKIQYIPAVEMDSLDNGVDIHILGYGMDLTNKVFIDFVAKNHILLEKVSIKLIEKMQEVIDSISLSDYLEFTYDKKKGGWKALHYFMKKGLTKNLKEGLPFYTKYDRSYDCVDFPTVSLVCEYIHNAGGKAILAHPGEVVKASDIGCFQKEVLRLINLGLDGIECYYPMHSKEITDVCLAICRDRNLLITAGSDCHGYFGIAEVGEMNISIDKINLGNICSIQ